MVGTVGCHKSTAASAGVPVIVSQHATRAIDPIPGAVAVEDSWDAWYEAIHQLSESGCEERVFDTTSAGSSGEKNTLVDVLRRLLDQ